MVFPNAIEEHLGGQDQVRLVGLAAFGLWAYGRRRRNGLPELHPLVISAQSEWELTQVLMQQVPTREDSNQSTRPYEASWMVQCCTAIRGFDLLLSLPPIRLPTSA